MRIQLSGPQAAADKRTSATRVTAAFSDCHRGIPLVVVREAVPSSFAPSFVRVVQGFFIARHRKFGGCDKHFDQLALFLVSLFSQVCVVARNGRPALARAFETAISGKTRSDCFLREDQGKGFERHG
ncbi:MAG: hypothetical protein L0228_02540 [Planctomycetes bacterium]|nr:hypothetical protein [Planctomycetota bacterium]